MNYIFGIGVALWALAGWVALRERAWPARIALSTACVSLLFFCHLSALGIYGVGVLSFEISRLWERRREPWPAPHRRFRRQRPAVPRRGAAALWPARPCSSSARTYWDQRGKIDGLMYVISDYSDIVAFAIIAVDGRQHRVGGPPPRPALSSAGLPAARRRRRGLFRAAAHHVRHLHDRSARADRRRLHAVRLRRSGVAPPPGAAGVPGRPDRVDHRAADRDRLQLVAIVGFDQRSSAPRCAASRPARRFSSPMPTARSARTCATSAWCMPPASPPSSAPRWSPRCSPCAGKQVLHVRPEFHDYADLRDGTPPSVAQLIRRSRSPAARGCRRSG